MEMKFKKYISILMVLVLAFSFAATGFAAADDMEIVDEVVVEEVPVEAPAPAPANDAPVAERQAPGTGPLTMALTLTQPAGVTSLAVTNEVFDSVVKKAGAATPSISIPNKTANGSGSLVLAAADLGTAIASEASLDVSITPTTTIPVANGYTYKTGSTTTPVTYDTSAALGGNGAVTLALDDISARAIKGAALTTSGVAGSSTTSFPTGGFTIGLFEKGESYALGDTPVKEITGVVSTYTMNIAAAELPAGLYNLFTKPVTSNGYVYSSTALAATGGADIQLDKSITADFDVLTANVTNTTQKYTANVEITVTGVDGAALTGVKITSSGALLTKTAAGSDTTNANGIATFKAAVNESGNLGVISFEAEGGNYSTKYYITTTHEENIVANASKVDNKFTINMTQAPTPTVIQNPVTKNAVLGAGQTLFSAKASSSADIEYVYQWQTFTGGQWVPVASAAQVTLDGEATLAGDITDPATAPFSNGAQFRVVFRPQLNANDNVFTDITGYTPTASTAALLNIVSGYQVGGYISTGTVWVQPFATDVNIYDKASYDTLGDSAISVVGPITAVNGYYRTAVDAVPNGTYVAVIKDFTTGAANGPKYKGGKTEFTVSGANISDVNIYVTADAAVKIDTQPVNQTVADGTANVSFTVAASRQDGDPLGLGLGYQWQVSTDGGKNFGNIDGATSATYTIAKAATAMDLNRYRVVVSAKGTNSSTTSNAVILRVSAFKPMTSVSIQSSADVSVNRELKVPVTVDGNGTINWTVYMKTSTSDWGQIGYQVAKNTDGVWELTIPADTIKDTWNGYQFRVKAQNQDPNNSNSTTNKYEATSNEMTLNIVAVTPISIVTDVKDIEGVKGRFPTFSVEVAGTAPYTYMWQYTVNGGTNWNSVSYASSATTNELTIPGTGGTTGLPASGFNSAFVGQVSARVRIVNKEGNGLWSTIGTVTSITDPVALGFAENPLSQEVVEGRDAKFTAQASGSEPYNYIWQKKVPGATNWETIGTWNNTADWKTAANKGNENPVAYVTAEMSGTQYRAFVTSFPADVNGMEPTGDTLSASLAKIAAVSTPATLTVVPFEELTIVTDPADATVYVGGSTEFSVVAGGSAPYTYQWQVSEDGGQTYTDVIPPSGTTYEDTMLLEGVTVDMNNFMYRVVVSNVEGDEVTSKAAVLTVVDITGLSIHGSTSVFPGEKLQLRVEFTTVNAEGETVVVDSVDGVDVVWDIAASSQSKATVDQNGLVTAITNGYLTVGAKIDGTDIKADRYKIVITDNLYKGGQGLKPWYCKLPTDGVTKWTSSHSNLIVKDGMVKINSKMTKDKHVDITATYASGATKVWNFGTWMPK